MSINPLLSQDGLPLFSRIRAEHIEPAVDAVLAENRSALARIVALDNPTWDDFVEPLETLDQRLHHTWSPAAYLNAVMNSPDIRQAYNACLPKLSDYATELDQNERLQHGYAELQSGPEWQTYNAAQRKLIEDALRDFKLTGVNLPADKKNRFRKIMQDLSQLEAKFEENLLDATQGWFKQVTEESSLGGIPQTALTRAHHEAQSRGQIGRAHV